MIHHRNEEIEKDDDIDYGEGTKHDEAPKSCEFFDSRKFEVVKIDQAKSCPKQSLRSFPQTEIELIV